MVIVAASAAASLALAGCVAAPAPRLRLGSMPFTGFMTLYSQADTRELGVHRYGPWWDRIAGPSESGRGTMYSCSVGFLDLSHIREYMDWTKYVHDRLRERLRAEEPLAAPAEFSWTNGNFVLTVTPPAWLATLPPAEREAAVQDASIRLAQRCAVIIATWHEIATWYGHSTVPGVSEKRSAFTWDDTTSHAVAAIVAGQALRSAEPMWDVAATAALECQLRFFGVLDPAQEALAVSMSKDLWWADSTPLRRDLDTGLETGFKTPWLVPGLPFCAGAVPARLPVELPPERWGDGSDRSWAGSVRLTIGMSRWLARRVMGTDEGPTQTIVDAESGMPGIMARLREHVLAECGPMGDQPDPPPASAAK
jgi:hypothetical protein